MRSLAVFDIVDVSKCSRSALADGLLQLTCLYLQHYDKLDGLYQHVISNGRFAAGTL
jgi:hypothetical protein